MADEIDLTQQIVDLASNPKKAESDGLSVEMQNISDLIDAQRFVNTPAAVANPSRGLRFTRLIQPGTI